MATASGAASGAATGAMIGSAGGPWGAAVGAGVGLLGGALLSGQGDKKLSSSQLGQLRGGINAGGLSSRLTNENRDVQITSSPQRQKLVNDLSAVLRMQASRLGILGSKVRPGVGALTAARRAQINAAERATLGDLRSNLSRRRVLGSTFAQDQESAVREQFGRAKAELDAESYLQELGLSTEYLAQKTAASAAALEVKLNEQNLQSQVALSILTGSQSAVGSAQQSAAALAASFKAAGISALTYGALNAGDLAGLGVKSALGTPTPGSVQGWREQLA